MFRRKVSISGWVLLIFFILLASLYSVINPLYEGTDELRHFRFVRALGETGRLPVQGQEPRRSQSHHPPLFYALGAGLTFWIPHQGDPYLARPENPFWGYRYWEVGTDNKNMYLHDAEESFPWSGAALAAHVCRFLNVGLGALTVALTASMMFTIFPQRRALGYGAAGLIAMNPMFLYMSGTINNDVAAAAAGAFVTLVCLLIVRRGVTDCLVAMLGLGCGLALLTKFSLLVVLVIAEFTLLYRTLLAPVNKRLSGRMFLRAHLLFLGGTAAIAGWWFVRNQLVYGEPTGFQAVTELWGVRSPLESIELAYSELPNAWSSLWGRFGYGQIPLPAWIYRLLGWVVAVGGVGTVLGISRLARRGADRIQVVQLILLVASVLIFFCVLYAYMLVSPAGSMGRFFFPGLPALVGLVFFGWAEWARLARRSQRWMIRVTDAALAAVSTLAMTIFALWSLFGFLAPAYATPAEASAADASSNLDAAFSDRDGPLARLLNYEMSADSVRPGGEWSVTFTWRALRPASQDYPLFIHLLDETGIVVAQRDTFHGLGNYPTSHWQAGHLFVETYRLHLPETAYAPATLTPQVGMYSLQQTYRLEADHSQSAIQFQPVKLDPLPGALPNPVEVNFGDRVLLAGYEISPRAVRPGEGIVFRFHWQVEQRLTQNYGVFLHVMDADERIWSSYDAPPGWTMTEWPPGIPVKDTRLLVLPSEMPPGIYRVEIGVWGIESGEGRLPIIAEDGHWVDDRLWLSPIRVLSSEGT